MVEKTVQLNEQTLQAAQTYHTDILESRLDAMLDRLALKVESSHSDAFAKRPKVESIS